MILTWDSGTLHLRYRMTIPAKNPLGGRVGGTRGLAPKRGGVDDQDRVQDSLARDLRRPNIAALANSIFAYTVYQVTKNDVTGITVKYKATTGTVSWRRDDEG